MSDDRIVVQLTPTDSGQLRAFADVTLCLGIGELTIKGCRVLHPPGQAPWIGFPQISYEREGQRKWKNVLDLSRGLKSKVTEAILMEFKKRVGGE
jgi:hypothetical protein